MDVVRWQNGRRRSQSRPARESSFPLEAHNWASSRAFKCVARLRASCSKTRTSRTKTGALGQPAALEKEEELERRSLFPTKSNLSSRPRRAALRNGSAGPLKCHPGQFKSADRPARRGGRAGGRVESRRGSARSLQLCKVELASHLAPGKNWPPLKPTGESRFFFASPLATVGFFSLRLAHIWRRHCFFRPPSAAAPACEPGRRP